MQNVTPAQPVTIIQVGGTEPTAPIDMIQVTIAAFGMTAVIMGAAVVAGLVAGAVYIWYRGRQAASTIEARGYQHNFFRVE